MQIDDLTLTLFSWENIPPTQYAAGSGNSSGNSTLGLLRISTDDGIEGHAFLGSATYSAEIDCKGIIHFLKPILMGADPLDREYLYQKMWKQNRKVSLRSIGAVDIALYDIAAKAAALPLYKFLGGYRDAIPAYASSAIMSDKTEYAEEAVKYKEDGWAAYKIHPPTIWRKDIGVCQAAREAVGNDFDLMLDSTWAYTYDNAIKVGRAIEDLNFYWYEDPLADDDLMGCIKLREKLSIPLIYEIHHGGNSLNNWANLHVILAIKNTTYFEVLLPSGAQKYGVIDDLEPNSQGMVKAPEQAGLGAKIDFDLIKSKTITTLK